MQELEVYQSKINITCMDQTIGEGQFGLMLTIWF